MSYTQVGTHNPFDDPNAPAGGGYSGAGYGGNVEMGNLNQGNPNAILNECRDIDQGVDEVERNLEHMRMLQDRALNDADTSGNSSNARQLESLSGQTMALYRELTDRVRQVKSSPNANQPKFSSHVGRVDRRLKQAIQDFQQLDSAYRKRTQEQMARQYRIVRPDADEEEVRAAVEDSAGGQVFQQALMQSDRRGQARAVLSAVQDRHAQIQRIEQQMIELAQLFQDLDTLVIQQDAAIVNIEHKGEEVVDNLDRGNQEISTAVTTAKSTRKKKWMCLGVVIAIIIVIVIIVVIVVLVVKPGSTGAGEKKRSLDIRGIDDIPTVQIQAEPDVPKLTLGDDDDDGDEGLDLETLPFIAHGVVDKPILARTSIHERRIVVPGKPFDANADQTLSKRIVLPNKLTDPEKVFTSKKVNKVPGKTVEGGKVADPKELVTNLRFVPHGGLPQA